MTSVLHEKRGGYANNTASIYGLAGKAEAEGVRILTGCKVTGFKFANGSGGAISAVETDRGTIECDYVVVGAGPWVKTLWDMLELPKTVDIKGSDGHSNDCNGSSADAVSSSGSSSGAWVSVNSTSPVGRSPDPS
jgi:L-2-hydroxyglutarate oxidase LhgO